MKHLRLQSLFLLLILHQLAWAGPRTFKQAQAIAERQAARMGVTISGQAKARSFGSSPSVSADAMTSSGTAAYYVFPYGEDKGYAIVSGDDQMPELVAYSDKGTLDETHMPDGCRYFLQAYKAVADAVAKGDEKALRQMAQKRGLLASADYKQPMVEPLLGDIQWNQKEPYNLMCPYNAHYECHVATGCVATAMAEVMRYWKYPNELKADIPAYTSISGSEVYEIPQINKGETYDWDNMLPQYVSGQYTDGQANAVAKLMYHCGAAVQMKYAVGESGAFFTSDVLTKYFGYDPDLICDVFRGEFSLGEWCRLMDGELTAKRPILYAGYSSSGGHMFVCDGADGKGLYHINWGWSDGSYNGYYDVSLLDPGRDVPGKGRDGFTHENFMIIGIQPDNGVKDAPVVETKALNVFTGDRTLTVTKAERTSVSEPFALDYFSYFINLRPKKVKALMNVGVKDEKGDYVPLLKDKYLADLEARGLGIDYPYDSLKVHIEYAFPVGTTQLHDIYSLDDGKTWQPCSYYEEAYPFEVVATETSLSVVPEKDDFKATLQAQGDLAQNQDCRFSYTMHNENAHDYFGTVEVYVSQTADEVPTRSSVDDYVSIEAGGSTTHYFTLTLYDEGDLYVWLYDAKHDKMMVEAQKFTVKGPAKLKMLSESVNWKENTFERENAYYDYDRAVLPVIDGDEAVFKYVIQNDGSDYNGGIYLYVSVSSADESHSGFLRVPKKCHLKGDGGVSELEYRFNKSELKDFRSFCAMLFLDNIYLGDIDYSLIPDNSIYLVDEDKMRNVPSCFLYGYFADTSTGITSAPAVIGGVKVTAGKGSLTITSDEAQSVAIYSLAGQCVRRLPVQAGTATTVQLPSGIYVIGKQKVMVR